MNKNGKQRRLLTVDPGSTGFGWVFWEDTVPVEAESYDPVIAKPHPNALRAWQQRADQAASELRFQINRLKPTEVACEFPKVYMDGKGYGAAGSGSIVKLSISVGQIMEICRQQSVKFTLIEVRFWRGTLEDENVIRRVKTRMGASVCQSLQLRKHAWDAAGIGLYHLTGIAL